MRNFIPGIASTIAAEEMTYFFLLELALPDEISTRNHIDNGDFAQWSNGTSAAPDGWKLSGHTGGAIAREGTIKKIGAYSAKLTSTTVAGQYNYLWRDVHDSFGIAYWRGRTITVGAWLWCDTAGAFSIRVQDGVGSDSTYHPGDGQWHWVTVTYTINASASIVRPYAFIQSGDGVARVGYVDGMILVEGSYCPAFDPRGYPTYRITDGDIPIIHEGETFLPIAFKFGDISGSATLAVESIDIEIDDTGKTLAAIVLNEDIRNKWAILSVGAIDSEYVVHVQEFLRGIIGGWQLYDENTLKITITNELVLWNKKPLRIQMSSCPWVFKGTECAYSGAESTCDQTYERCRFLSNTDNFGGDRFINSLMQKEIWWGRTQKL